MIQSDIREFEHSSLKKLDASPIMSDNCWNAIRSKVADALASKQEVSFLEWGAGNSTLALVKLGLASHAHLRFISVEHDTRFFAILADSIITEFTTHSPPQDISVEWNELSTVSFPIHSFPKYFKRFTSINASSYKWQVISGSKRTTYTEDIRPNFNPSLRARAKNCLKFLLLLINYFIWVLNCLMHSFERSHDTRATLSFALRTVKKDEALLKAGAFIDFFATYPRAGCLQIRTQNVTFTLWHLPTVSFFGTKELILEGSYLQLPNYIDVPLEGKFDFVFVDGRARVSCIKRAFEDALLCEGGTLFVHDAFRPDLQEIYASLKIAPMFINGSNRMTNGQIRWEEHKGLPLARINLGEERETELCILQELFIYEKK